MAKPILLFKPIYEDTAQEIVVQLLASESDVVDIWMNTPGGAISCGWSILATLNELNKQVDITVLGNADSFGFFMLLFSRKNKAFDSSNFTVHRAASFWEEAMTEEELKVIEDRNKVFRSKMDSRLNEAKFKEVTGVSFDDIFTMKDRLDVTLNAQQAKEIGLIDEVVTINTARREEIEGRYINDIAALAIPKKGGKVISNINTNNNNMGNIFKAIFGEKDPILLAQIGENQCLYSKLEKGSKIRAVGADEVAISGTFEADNKHITVIENEITAVVEVNAEVKRIEALTAEVAELKALIVTPKVEVPVNPGITKLEAEVKELKNVIATAKLNVSNPELPKGEFDEGNSPVKALSSYELQKKIDAQVKEKRGNK